VKSIIPKGRRFFDSLVDDNNIIPAHVPNSEFVLEYSFNAFVKRQRQFTLEEQLVMITNIRIAQMT